MQLAERAHLHEHVWMDWAQTAADDIRGTHRKAHAPSRVAALPFSGGHAAMLLLAAKSTVHSTQRPR